MIRVVFDTNVMISGLLWQGIPQRLLRLAIQEYFVLLASEPLIAELDTVLQRPKFAKQLIQTNRSRERTLIGLRQFVEMVSPVSLPYSSVRDAKDVMILECAVGGRANYIVSGDKDLLVLIQFDGIPIVTPQQFLEQL